MCPEYAGSKAGSPRRPPLLARLASGSWAGVGSSAAGRGAVPEFGPLSARNDTLAKETRAMRYGDMNAHSTATNSACADPANAACP
jgi:hypothetical protein